MLSSKKFEKVIILITVIAFVGSLILVMFPNMFSSVSRNGTAEDYSVKLFGKNIVNINIDAEADAWNEMLENKMQKPYIPVNLTIDGKEFDEVGIRPKGNSSLTSIQGERISFRFDFDHYVDNQNCYGLEQMVINNLQADATYMKDYIAYDLMQYMGVNAPLHTYANITLNGEPFGVYLLSEVYEQDYLERVYDDTSIRLYSVKSSGLDEFENAVIDAEGAEVISSEGIEKNSGMGMGGPPPGPPPGGPGGMGGGGDLVYTDDSTESYQNIFANAVFDDTDAKDYAKVIRAIKYLNKENVSEAELEEYWNIDEILRYFAVHTFMVNGDSYYGNMMQNYYLAEQNGKVSVLPWDYNLSFGSFGGPPQGGMPAEDNGAELDSTTEVINHAIDTPVIDVNMEDRPLLSVLLGNDKYKEQYHAYLKELTEYASGDFLNKLTAVNNEISPYIQKEKVSFFSYEEHEKAFWVLYEFMVLRCQSINAQLEGRIPSVSEEQKHNIESLVRADFSIDEMGTMGGPGGGPPPGMGNMNGQGMPQPPNGDNGQSVPQPPQDGQMPQGQPPQGGMGQPPQGMPPQGNGQGMMPPPPPGMPGMTQNQGSNTGWIIAALIILCISIFGVKIFKRTY